MEKKRPKYNAHAALRGAIRRTFSRSPMVREVLWAHRREVPKYNKDGTRAKKNAVQYKCYVCSEWVSSTKIQVDHVIPVIDPQLGFVDWNTFIDRVFCDSSNLRPICLSCHGLKTNTEKLLAKARRETEKRKVGYCEDGSPILSSSIIETISSLKIDAAKTLAISTIESSSASEYNKEQLITSINKTKSTKKMLEAIASMMELK